MLTLYFALGIGQKPDMRVVATGSTMKEEILLEDGSVVVLNSGSQLTYPKSFDDDSRDVILAGEAYFDVTPDKNRPFVIIAGNTGITVLGTSFNVYNSHTGTEVLVETGRVKFAGQSDPEKYVMLDPGDKGNYTDITKEIKKQKNSDPNIMAWKTGKLVFEETDLSDVCRTVEKVYHISIDIPDESIASLRLTATFNNLEAEQVLDIICQTLGLSLELHENKYKLSKNG